MPRKLSASDLADFRTLLLNVRGVVSGDIDSLESDAFGVEAERPPADNPADAGSDSFSQEFSLELLARDEETLHEIDEALDRIAGGTFGICEDCEKPIPKTRLRAIPFARLCVDCKRAAESA